MTKQLTNESCTYGVSSLVCAVLSWFLFGIILAPLSIVFGCISLSKKEKNSILAILGIAVGAVACAVLLISYLMLMTAVSVYR